MVCTKRFKMSNITFLKETSIYTVLIQRFKAPWSLWEVRKSFPPSVHNLSCFHFVLFSHFSSKHWNLAMTTRESMWRTIQCCANGRKLSLAYLSYLLTYLELNLLPALWSDNFYPCARLTGIIFCPPNLHSSV